MANECVIDLEDGNWKKPEFLQEKCQKSWKKKISLILPPYKVSSVTNVPLTFWVEHAYFIHAYFLKIASVLLNVLYSMPRGSVSFSIRLKKLLLACTSFLRLYCAYHLIIYLLKNILKYSSLPLCFLQSLNYFPPHSQTLLSFNINLSNIFYDNKISASFSRSPLLMRPKCNVLHQ